MALSAPMTDLDANVAEGLAFDDVYARHADFVHAVLRRLGVDRDRSEDALQEVFLVVHRRLHTFEGRAALRSWLYGIAVRVSRAHHRREAFSRLWTPLFSASETIADDRDASEGAERGEGLRVLDRLLDTMPRERREVFVLVEIEELTVVEVAAIVRCNVNTARSRLRLARCDFERALARHHAREERRLR
jgi:RNA polymerase sigma-70 factor, ECF subfamily